MQQDHSSLCDGAPSKRVAIIGAGPIGIELALSALQRGMAVTVFESGDAVGAQMLLWKHGTLFSPWSMNTSDAGWRVLELDGKSIKDERSVEWLHALIGGR